MKKKLSNITKVIDEYRLMYNKELFLDSIGVSYDLFRSHHRVIDNLLSCVLSVEELDWFHWWAFEAGFGENKTIANSVKKDGKHFVLETTEQFVEFLFKK